MYSGFEDGPIALSVKSVGERVIVSGRPLLQLGGGLPLGGMDLSVAPTSPMEPVHQRLERKSRRAVTAMGAGVTRSQPLNRSRHGAWFND